MLVFLYILQTSQILSEANKELIEVARRTNPSVLRRRSYDGMSAEGWMTEVLDEIATRCPVVNNILSTLLESSIDTRKKNPVICLIYGIIMFLRCHELSRIQRINSVLLVEGQASLNVSHLMILLIISHDLINNFLIGYYTSGWEIKVYFEVVQLGLFDLAMLCIYNIS
jgi:hypothetical protein